MSTDPAAEIGVSQIIDHRYFVSASREPWERCEICGFGEAAHARAVGRYTPTATTKRCPNCVKLDIDPCLHG